MTSLATQLSALQHRGALTGTTVALVIAEDEIALPETVGHLLARGFANVIVAVPDGLDLAPRDPKISVVRAPTEGTGATEALVNALLSALPEGVWFHYCYNAEFLHYPFAETRSIAAMLDFHAGERRKAMATMVVDVFARDLERHPTAVDLERPAFDATGYFETDGQVTGGLRWRLASHVPAAEQPLHRYALVKTTKGLRLGPGHLWSDPTLNTLSCPWHHNLTAAIASFRAAKALTKAGHAADLDWAGAATFDWSSEQLLNAGFMEVGQWF